MIMTSACLQSWAPSRTTNCHCGVALEDVLCSLPKHPEQAPGNMERRLQIGPGTAFCLPGNLFVLVVSWQVVNMAVLPPLWWARVQG